MKYLSITEVQSMDGLRIVACIDAPSPWSLAARAVFDYKGVPYSLGGQIIADENVELKAWTGQNSAPVVAYRYPDNDFCHGHEKFATTAESIILLAEQLQPEPALVPNDPQQRAWMFGLLQSLAGEDGFAWGRRLMSLAMLGSKNLSGNIKTMALKYNYSDGAAVLAEQRVADVLQMFSTVLKQQQENGSAYLVGRELSALDLYFAIFIGIMYRPMSHEQIPIPEMMRVGYEVPNATLDAAADDILFEHRDRIFADHLPLPLTF